LKTCGLLVFGLVLIEICLFFGLVFCRFLFCGLPFFQILWHFYCLNLLLKACWACFCEDLLILGLCFRICHPDSLFDFLANFSFCWIFLPTHFGLVFSVKLPIFGLLFKFTCLFLENNLASLSGSTVAGYALGRRTIVVLCYAYTYTVVRSIFSDCVLFYHAFQVKSTQIHFDTYYPCISYCWARLRDLQKIVYPNWGSTCRKVWEPLV